MSLVSRLARLVLLLLVAASATAFADRRAYAGETRPSGAEGVPGSLVLCGGGKLPPAVFAEFLELGGGHEARLVVIPTASREREDLDPEAIREAWRARGVESLAVLHTRSREVADRDGFVEPLKQSTAVWFGGGAQSRIADTYVRTAVERELHALLARGGVVGGTSAGAAVQSRTMIARGNPDAEIERGFDLLPGSVVDQHFLTRNRKQRLIRVLRDRPELVGFGIDERTALIVSGRRLRVLGESTVTVLLAAYGSRPAREIELASGAEADLAALHGFARERVQPTVTGLHARAGDDLVAAAGPMGDTASR